MPRQRFVVLPELLLTVLLLLVVACDNLAPAYRTIPINRTSHLGTALTSAASNVLTNFAWSPDGSRIYVGLGAPLQTPVGALHAIVVATGQDQVLTTGTVPLTSVRVSTDGAWVYFSGGGRLSRVSSSGGTPEFVRDSVGTLYRVSADGRGLVYGYPQPDDVRVVGTQSGAVTILPRGWPVAYSPAGDEMVYCCADSTRPGSSAVIVSLVTGVARSAGIAVDSGEYWVGTRWDDGGIRLLVMRAHSVHGGWDFLMRSLSGGPDQLLLADSTEGYLGSVSWSANGGRVAFWKYVFGAMDAGGDVSQHWALYVATAQGANTSWVAGTDDVDVGCMLFSPNAGSIAYVLSTGTSRLYLSPVP